MLLQGMIVYDYDSKFQTSSYTLIYMDRVGPPVGPKSKEDLNHWTDAVSVCLVNLE